MRSASAASPTSCSPVACATRGWSPRSARAFCVCASSSSLKAVRDGVADALGLASDRDPRVAWVVDQERGEPRQYAVRVEVTP